MRKGDGGVESGDDGGVELYFPTYEELASEILEGLEREGLVAMEVGHDLEPTTGERTFQTTVQLASADSAHRYPATVHFHWDGLLTYLGTYGPGSECDLYHDDAEECSHQRTRPHPVVEIICEYDLGEGGYELHQLTEVEAWFRTVEQLLAKAVPGQEGRTVRIGLAVRDGSTWVDRFFAEQSWYLDLSQPPELSSICASISLTLKATPALADRLPL